MKDDLEEKRVKAKEIYNRLYKDNPEFKAKKKAYYQENREAILERRRKYRANNSEKIAAYRREWYRTKKLNLLNQMCEVK